MRIVGKVREGGIIIFLRRAGKGSDRIVSKVCMITSSNGVTSNE